MATPTPSAFITLSSARRFSVIINPEEALNYQKELFDLIEGDVHYQNLRMNPDKSYGGFFHRRTIETILGAFSGIRFHFCWDDAARTFFIALQGGVDIIDADPITDDPGMGTFYKSLNLFCENRGNVSLFNFIPLTYNLNNPPTTNIELLDKFYSEKTIESDPPDNNTLTRADIKSLKEKFRTSFHRGVATLYTVTWFQNTVLNDILNQPDCIGIRYYFGYSREEEHIVKNPFRIFIVGVNSSGDDILIYHRPASSPSQFFEGRFHERSHP